MNSKQQQEKEDSLNEDRMMTTTTTRINNDKNNKNIDHHHNTIKSLDGHLEQQQHDEIESQSIAFNNPLFFGLGLNSEEDDDNDNIDNYNDLSSDSKESLLSNDDDPDKEREEEERNKENTIATTSSSSTLRTTTTKFETSPDKMKIDQEPNNIQSTTDTNTFSGNTPSTTTTTTNLHQEQQLDNLKSQALKLLQDIEEELESFLIHYHQENFRQIEIEYNQLLDNCHPQLSRDEEILTSNWNTKRKICEQLFHNQKTSISSKYQFAIDEAEIMFRESAKIMRHDLLMKKWKESWDIEAEKILAEKMLAAFTSNSSSLSSANVTGNNSSGNISGSLLSVSSSIAIDLPSFNKRRKLRKRDLDEWSWLMDQGYFPAAELNGLTKFESVKDVEYIQYHTKPSSSSFSTGISTQSSSEPVPVASINSLGVSGKK